MYLYCQKSIVIIDAGHISKVEPWSIPNSVMGENVTTSRSI